MALSSSEIDRLLDIPTIDSDSSVDHGSSDSEVDGILSNSGSDSFEPSSQSSSDDDYEEKVPKPRKIKRVGKKRSISELLKSMNSKGKTSHDLPSPSQDSSSSHQNLNIPPQDPDTVILLNSNLLSPAQSQPSSSYPNLNILPHDMEIDTVLNPDVPLSAQASSSSSHLNLEAPPQNLETDILQLSPQSSQSRTTRVIKGKNGYCWTKEPRASVSRTRAKNIVYVAPKVKGTANNAITPSQSFLSFITDENIAEITKFTNEEICRKKAKYREITASVEITDTLELKAFIGVLLFSAVHKDNHLSMKDMFDSVSSGNMYKAAFSEKRFSFLLDCLRFDDKETREDRRKTDKFAPIRDFWDSLIKKCIENYEPGPYLTIDEQLLAFRGRCPFKMYIPNKPSKYGIKIVMICDVGTKYMLNAEPYLGKGSTGRGQPASHHYVKSLSAPFHGTNRNLTMDNWFSSIPLTIELSKAPINLTVIGTIRKNKGELPMCMISPKNRELGDVRYLFDGTITLVSQKVKSNKTVCLISSMHDRGGTSASGKPTIIEHYNQTKGGVDAFDQMCSGVSCSRKTKRWPMCLFFGMINMAGINSYIVHNINLRKKGESQISRKVFLKAVCRDFVTPLLERRLQLPTIQRYLKNIISEVLNIRSEAPEYPPRNNRTNCKICPAKKRRMTTNHCLQCGLAYCNEHRGGVCYNCTHQN